MFAHWLAEAEAASRMFDPCKTLAVLLSAHVLQLGPNCSAINLPLAMANNPADPNALYNAIDRIDEEEDATEVQQLLDAGADVNVVFWHHGRTALTGLDYPAVIQKLLDAGADVNARDNEGDTALEVAACLGHIRAVKVLLSSPELAPAVMADAASAAATEIGTSTEMVVTKEIAIMVLQTLMERDRHAAVAALADALLADVVLTMWEASELKATRLQKDLAAAKAEAAALRQQLQVGATQQQERQA